MDDPNTIMHQSIFRGEVSKLLPIIQGNTTLRSKPHHAVRGTIDNHNTIMHQSIFRGEVSKFLPIVPGNTTVARAKPHYTVRVIMNGVDPVPR